MDAVNQTIFMVFFFVAIFVFAFIRPILNLISNRFWLRHRAKRIALFAKSAGWEFHQRSHLPQRLLWNRDSFPLLNFIYLDQVANVLHRKRTYDNVDLMLCDSVRQFKVVKDSINSESKTRLASAQTFILLTFHNRMFPKFELAPANWGDRFLENVIRSEYVTVYTAVVEEMAKIFTAEALKNYRWQHIEGCGPYVLIYRNKASYGPTDKEGLFSLIEDANDFIGLVERMAVPYRPS